VKGHGNTAAGRHFGPPQTEKMICAWRKKEEELLKLEKNKHSSSSNKEHLIQIKNR
jgi:hypothetical protein